MNLSTFALPTFCLLSVVLFVLWLKARRVVDGFKEKYSPIMSIEAEADRLQISAEKTRKETEELQAQYAEKRAILQRLEQQVAIYDESLAFAELGIYEPHFDFGDSETYKEQIKAVRERQKAMVSAKTATTCPANWHVDGSLSKGKTMINRQTRLTMRAFNKECEAAIANTRWNNALAMEKRIVNAAKQINKAKRFHAFGYKRAIRCLEAGRVASKHMSIGSSLRARRRNAQKWPAQSEKKRG